MNKIIIFLATSCLCYGQDMDHVRMVLSRIAETTPDGAYDSAPVATALTQMKSQNLINEDDRKELFRAAMITKAKSFRHHDGRLELIDAIPWQHWPQPKPQYQESIRVLQLNRLDQLQAQIGPGESVVAVVVTRYQTATPSYFNRIDFTATGVAVEFNVVLKQTPPTK